MKTLDMRKNLRKKSIGDLEKERDELLREQFNLRMQRGVGQAARPDQFSKVRKNIARINTMINEKQRAGEAS
jgi:large subunit ribosomal protein L29